MKKSVNIKCCTLGLGGIIIGAAQLQAAGEADAFKSWCDDAWGLATLYKNDENPVIQKLAFTGRAQFDYAFVDGEGMPKGGAQDNDLNYEEFNTRRLRAGFKATLFKDFTAHVEGSFDPDVHPVYLGLTDAYIGWKYSDALGIKVGKQSMGFTLDGKTSSKELLTIDRNNLAGNLWFTNEYIPGITVGGQVGNWVYNAGVFSQGNSDKGFGNFNAGTSWLASLGYDLSDALGVEEATVAIDYVYNENTPAAPALYTNRSLGQVISLNGTYHDGNIGFRGDISYGDGFLGQPDTFGFVLMPYIDLTENLQLVARYTFIDSDGNDGVRFSGYENTALNGGKGDQYQEGYLGLNYYLYGHKLKLQTGLQYVSMRDRANNGGAFDGLSLTTGLRISW